MRNRLGWPGVALLACVACGGTTHGSPGDAGTDSVAPLDGHAPVDATPLDAPADAPEYLACFDDSGTLSYSLKGCHADADCVIEQEQTDCCGTILYVGVASTFTAQFAACEMAWVDHFPGCGCASDQTKTEDGKDVYGMPDGSAPLVHCTDFTNNGGVCLTYRP